MAQTSPRAALSAAPMSGTAPLAVEFVGGSGGQTWFGGLLIDFGDGSTSVFCRPGGACQDARKLHTYQQRGAYNVRLLGQGEGEAKVLATLTVSVD
jgi:PKD repeat protein